MADTKISAFGAASALAGTEVLAGVQSAANAKITIDQIKTYCRTRADVLIDSNAISRERDVGQTNHIVYAGGTWYKVYGSGDIADIWWTKSTNKGLTWSTPTLIKATSIGGIAVWYDKWTPGDSGTLLHIAYFETSTNNVLYRSLDTSNDTLGTEITVFAGASLVAGANSCISVTKSKGARILVGFDGDGGTETGFYKSNDFPVTGFTSKTDFQEATTDYYILLPGNYADTNDIDCIFWDRTASEITLKTYDDSANNWTGVSAETSIATSMTAITAGTVSPQFAAAVALTSVGSLTAGHAYVAAWSNADTAAARLQCWDINGAGSITAKTDIVSSSTDDQGAVAIGLDTGTGNLYAFYLGKTDGSETAFTAINVYYKISTDGGATWGSETLLTTQTRVLSHLNCSPTFASAEFVINFLGAGLTNFNTFTSALS